MESAPYLTFLLLLADWVVRIGFSVRVILRKRSTGVSLAWLAIVLLIPFVGAVVYLLVGENRLGRRRAERLEQVREPYRERLSQMDQGPAIDWSQLPPACQVLHRQAYNTIAIPTLDGNRLSLMIDTSEVLEAMSRDIDQAKHSCHVVFYIWSLGGGANEVAEALMRAAGRGVACRVLLDGVGSYHFLGSELARRMRGAGVQLVEALPVNLLRLLFRRLDLRNHRKIMVIDGEVAYTGSQNLADARLFKIREGVGEWIDAMVRVEGPVVEVLNLIFLADWELETEIGLEELQATGDVKQVQSRGDTKIQVVPSGPGLAPMVIHEMLLTTIYAAQKELIMTTPYFVPDDAMLMALQAAGHRGVDVTLMVPEKNDSWLVSYASRSHFDELLLAGVKIARFTKGLLHAKTITVDRQIGVIGSGNMDMRSFWLNFEVTLFVYGADFTEQIRDVQMRYLEQSEFLNTQQWLSRGHRHRFVENCCQLLGPLL